HLRADSTIDVPLQKRVTDFFDRLSRPEVIKAYGLNGERMLEADDPAKLIYSFLLVEATPNGNVVRVQADTLATALDFNKSVKLELGSTAKLRTLTHYLELIAELHKELSGLDPKQLHERGTAASDPLTKWAAETLRADKALALQPFLDNAMERKYSGSPYEAFFTGGGVHHFENFDKQENERKFEVREALRHSNNLTFIRLMRDLVSYHRARLAYNAGDVIDNPDNPTRQQMLKEIADEESRAALRRAYQNYAKQPGEEIVKRLLAGKGSVERRLAVLFFAWRVGTDEDALTAWLEKHEAKTSAAEVSKLFRAYQNPRLTLADHAYLLGIHPLDLWCAGEFRKNAKLSWKVLYAKSGPARQVGSAWLLNSRNQRAQNNRLRIRIEKDAFARMTPYWQRLGFPFKTLVPSYATAIGVSTDRPTALAELAGILVNDGVRRPTTTLTRIHFAGATPYETVLERPLKAGEQVLVPEVARTMRKAMAEVVEQGTARRLNGAFKLADGSVLTVGGKTGSGDNRFETFNRSGGVVSSRATNRTATFVFYIGERYYGVITAYVQGRAAGNYHFTSALPVTLLKMLAPSITAKFDNKKLDEVPPPVGEPPPDVTVKPAGAAPTARTEPQPITP
ncbi:MAG: penicillin-binding transpeptidase domain-containing protein, partial [Candidatus Binatia bacterium]